VSTSVHAHRLGDLCPAPRGRSERVYRRGLQWYVSTREGTPIGPFATRTEAEQGLEDFLEFLRLAPLGDVAALTDALTPDAGERGDDTGRH